MSFIWGACSLSLVVSSLFVLWQLCDTLISILLCIIGCSISLRFQRYLARLSSLKESRVMVYSSSWRSSVWAGIDPGPCRAEAQLFTSEPPSLIWKRILSSPLYRDRRSLEFCRICCRVSMVTTSCNEALLAHKEWLWSLEYLTMDE